MIRSGHKAEEGAKTTTAPAPDGVRAVVGFSGE